MLPCVCLFLCAHLKKSIKSTSVKYNCCLSSSALFNRSQCPVGCRDSCYSCQWRYLSYNRRQSPDLWCSQKYTVAHALLWNVRLLRTVCIQGKSSSYINCYLVIQLDFTMEIYTNRYCTRMVTDPFKGNFVNLCFHRPHLVAKNWH